ncbi:MAG: flagellar hook-length control protein FliK [Rickettsiaceae bacterium]|nr:flagellar hook-length control protein FliK [Rickettsiaceae bacterium]
MTINNITELFGVQSATPKNLSNNSAEFSFEACLNATKNQASQHENISQIQDNTHSSLPKNNLKDTSSSTQSKAPEKDKVETRQEKPQESNSRNNITEERQQKNDQPQSALNETKVANENAQSTPCEKVIDENFNLEQMIANSANILTSNVEVNLEVEQVDLNFSNDNQFNQFFEATDGQENFAAGDGLFVQKNISRPELTLVQSQIDDLPENNNVIEFTGNFGDDRVISSNQATNYIPNFDEVATSHSKIDQFVIISKDFGETIEFANDVEFDMSELETDQDRQNEELDLGDSYNENSQYVAVQNHLNQAVNVQNVISDQNTIISTASLDNQFVIQENGRQSQQDQANLEQNLEFGEDAHHASVAKEAPSNNETMILNDNKSNKSDPEQGSSQSSENSFAGQDSHKESKQVTMQLGPKLNKLNNSGLESFEEVKKDDQFASGQDMFGEVASKAGLTRSLSIEDIANPDQIKFAQVFTAPKTDMKVTDQITLAVQKASNDRVQKIQVGLHPEHLGKVDIELNIQNDVIKEVKFIIHKRETFETIKADRVSLEQMVKDITKGGDAKLSFSFGSFNNQDQQNATNPYLNKSHSDQKIMYQAVKKLATVSEANIVTENRVNLTI